MPEESSACDKNLLDSDLCHVKAARPIAEASRSFCTVVRMPMSESSHHVLAPSLQSFLQVGSLAKCLRHVLEEHPAWCSRVYRFSRLFRLWITTCFMALLALRAATASEARTCFVFIFTEQLVLKVVAVLIGENLVTAAVGEALRNAPTWSSPS